MREDIQMLIIIRMALQDCTHQESICRTLARLLRRVLAVALAVEVAEEHQHVHHDEELEEREPRGVLPHVQHVERVHGADAELQHLAPREVHLPRALYLLPRAGER